jgi:aspartate aminotransferase-like enzyme
VLPSFSSAADRLVSDPSFGDKAEFSVVYTDRALNHMSEPFKNVMNELSTMLKHVYNAHCAIIMPGSGTYGMEAVARQFAPNQKVLVIRNGWFSYRWTQIFEEGSIPSEEIVLKGKCSQPDCCGGVSNCARISVAPPKIEDVVTTIRSEKPAAVFAPHVETSVGLILPDDYIKAMSAAAHEVGAVFVLDCIASGTVWVDMKELGVDALITAPQKGWTGPACAGLIMLSEAGKERMDSTKSTSFVCNLKTWHNIMTAYETGGMGYHCTMPTDALRQFRDVGRETEALGWASIKNKQLELGAEMRKMFAERGFRSTAAPGFEAPGVLVFHSPKDLDNPAAVKAFAQQGIQIAAGVPWMIDEPKDQKTFRIGLFGLDKMADVQRTVSILASAVDAAGLKG